MARGSLSSSSEQLCEINVTPMIDVLLSLLIIFMVATPPPPNEAQPIALPAEPLVQQPDNPNATLVITIADDGIASLGDKPMPREFDKMVEVIKASEKAQQDSRVAIDGSAKIPYGRMIEVMRAAREAGISSVGIASDRI